MFTNDKHRFRFSDTEKAIQVSPNESCCEDVDECECVTSADAERWDWTYDTVSAYSADWGGDTIQEIILSSAVWNSAYEAFLEYSGNWSSAYDFSQDNYDIGDYRNSLNELLKKSIFLDTYGGQSELYARSGISGIGTEDAPFILSREVTTKINDAYTNMLELKDALYEDGVIDEAYRNWASLENLTDILKRIESVETKNNEQDNEDAKLWSFINKMGDLTSVLASAKAYTDEKTAATLTEANEYTDEKIAEIVISGGGVTLSYEADMTYDNASGYNTENTLYWNND